MRYYIYFAIAFIFLALVGQQVNAATSRVQVDDEGQTYIQMTGSNITGDADRLRSAITKAKSTKYLEKGDIITDDGRKIGETEVEIVRIFSNELKVKGPGGNFFPAIRLAFTIRAEGLNTIANGSCASGCGLAFIAGVERSLEGDTAKIGFHMPTVHEWRPLEGIMKTKGFLGIQDSVNSSAALFSAVMSYMGLDQDWIVLYEMARIESSRGLFWVDHENFSLIGKLGRVH